MMALSAWNGLSLLSAVVESHLHDETNAGSVQHSRSRDVPETHERRSNLASASSTVPAWRGHRKGTSWHCHDKAYGPGVFVSPTSTVAKLPTPSASETNDAIASSETTCSVDHGFVSLEVMNETALSDGRQAILPKSEDMVMHDAFNSKKGVAISKCTPIRVPRAVKATLHAKRDGSCFSKTSPQWKEASSPSWPNFHLPTPPSIGSLPIHPSTKAASPSSQNANSHSALWPMFSGIMFPYHDPHSYNPRLLALQQQLHQCHDQETIAFHAAGHLQDTAPSSVRSWLLQVPEKHRQQENAAPAVANRTKVGNEATTFRPGGIERNDDGQDATPTLPCPPLATLDAPLVDRTINSTRSVQDTMFNGTRTPPKTPPHHRTLSSAAAADATNESSPSSQSCSLNGSVEIKSKKRKAIPMREKWMARYEELVQFKNKYGHTKVPHNFEDSPKLAEWQKFQRQQRKLYVRGKHSQLTPDRVNLLDRIGFVWEARLDAWEAHYEDLKAFQVMHGHVHVPVANTVLSQWIKRQRKQFKKFERGEESTLTADRVERLNRLGFLWDGRHLAE